MAENSRFWNGTATGDATDAPYDAPTEFAAVLRSISGAAAIATNLGGVFAGELNELEVTAPGSVSPASVDTGRALAYGNWYENTAAVSVAIPTPSGATRIDRIVLRKSWALQTVRVTRIEGVEGGAAPSLVQVAGTTWDTPLAQVSITTGGAATVTDEREFLGGVNVQVFTSSGTWTQPARAKAVFVLLFGAGGGGGGGGGGAAGSNRGGGGGGGGGAYNARAFVAAQLGSTETVTVPAGGTVGTGGSTAAGNPGGIGGKASFGAWLEAYGGGGGAGGRITTTDNQGGGGGGGRAAAGTSGSGSSNGSGGAPRGGLTTTSDVISGAGANGGGHNAEFGGGGGGPSVDATASDGDGGGSLFGAGGGGGAGQIETDDVQRAGAPGGATFVYANGSGGAGGAAGSNPGTAGTSRSGSGAAGNGGGGGGSSSGATGGAGGAGGIPGGGGGAGGGGTTVGGAGGLGGRGEVIVITTLG